jgi:hypothetical protein
MFCLVRGRIWHVVQPQVIANSVILNWRLRALGSAICLFLGFMLLLTSRLDAKESRPEEVGIVLKLKGEWLLNGKAVAAGEKLPAGGKIYHPPPKAGEPGSTDYISVVFFDGTIESRSWDKAESWNSPIQLPAARKEAPSRWSRIVNAVMGIFPGHPEKYTQMSVRGPAMDVQDAVVDLNNGQLDLGPAFKQLKKGQYLIILEPIQQTKAPAEEATSKPVLFDWDPNQSPALRVDGIRPGLYSLRIQNAHSNDTSGDRSKAWILASEHTRYESTAAAFQECVTLTENGDRKHRLTQPDHFDAPTWILSRWNKPSNIWPREPGFYSSVILATVASSVSGLCRGYTTYPCA